jgi:hypothetical protein
MIIVVKHNDGEGCSLAAVPYASHREAEDAVMNEITELIVDSGVAYQHLVDECLVAFDSVDAYLELYGVLYEWGIREVECVNKTQATRKRGK